MEIKSAKINKSVSLENKTVNELNNSIMFEDLSDFSSKVDTATSEYVSIINQSLLEIKERFTLEEMNVLLNACNMIVIASDKISPALTIHNSIVFHSKHFDVELTEEFENKVLELTSAQAYALLRAIYSYWFRTDFKIVESLVKK